MEPRYSHCIDHLPKLNLVDILKFVSKWAVGKDVALVDTALRLHLVLMAYEIFGSLDSDEENNLVG